MIISFLQPTAFRVSVWAGLLLCSPLLASAENRTSDPADLARQVTELRAMVEQLQVRVTALEGKKDSAGDLRVSQPEPAASLETASLQLREKSAAETETAALPRSFLSSEARTATLALLRSTLVKPQAPAAAPAPVTSPRSVPDLLGGTTLNFLVDGYYDYNFNDPIGRDTLLRAYDVISNAFSLNQADLVLENAPDLATGKRFGARFDLQFGQATANLQGNAANEPRPAVYRNIYQAYGTFVVPLGKGLTVDFGKWASSLGLEGNYTKDQMNYSRSYWFDFLPFYHMGIRAHYQFNDKFGVNYWVTNGTQQTEPFNGYKDEMFGIALQPAKSLSWTTNYYLGQEHPDFQYVTNGPPNLPTISGQPFEPITNPGNGKTHIFDSYATWNASPKLTLALEGDYEIVRLYLESPPSHTDGGAAYAHFQISPVFALAGRTEYMSDRGGLFSGTTQALKENTLTFEQKVSEGFLIREEWRRDYSNRPYFLTDTLGVLSPAQTTATMGVVWWFGGKQGAW